MTYQAITIDAQVVYKNSRNLDRGIVGQMDQYKDGPIEVVLTEVVLRELIKMLEIKAKAAHDALDKAIREGDLNGQLSAQQKTQIQSVLDSLVAPDEHAKGQIKEFIARTGAKIIPADSVSLTSILDAYFGKHPPFSSKGKKDEFPDAISLLALEKWAKSENTKVLAVSGDEDWKAFAAQSEWIDCVDDLGAAMEMLLAAVGAVEVEARAVIASIADESKPELKEKLEADLARAIERESPHIEFTSSMQGEDEGAYFTLTDFSFRQSSNEVIEITVLRIRAEGFVVRVPVVIKAEAFVDINFSIYDSVDKDYVPMGSASVQREVEFDAYALIEFSKHPTADAEHQGTEYEIDSAEIVGAPRSIDIGYVDYSLADDEPEFDAEDWSAEPKEETEMPF